MLINIGDVWVDPSKIEGICFESGMLRICTPENTFHSHILDKTVDDCAALINNALNGQSYGGEENIPKE